VGGIACKGKTTWVSQILKEDIRYEIDALLTTKGDDYYRVNDNIVDNIIDLFMCAGWKPCGDYCEICGNLLGGCSPPKNNERSQ
jgi:hypothetical protein